MRFLPALALVSAALVSAGCSATPYEPAEGDAASATTTATPLRASTDPTELQLASVEKVLGFGIKAITLWNRNTETNGRDLWLTIRSSDGAVSRAWRTRENILDITSVQLTTGRTRFIGQEHTEWGSIYETPRPVSQTEFWLDVNLDTAGGGIGPSVQLERRGLQPGTDRTYAVDATTDPLSSLIGQIDGMHTAVGTEARARLITLDPTQGREKNGKKLVLVLVDAEAYRVFPLALAVNRENNFAFAGPRELVFDAIEQAPDYRETTKRYAITWTDTRAPSIRPLP